MVLYCCQTNYQLLECITHKINYNNEKESVLIYHEGLPFRYGIKEKNLLKIFDKIYAYPTKDFLSTWDANNIKSVGDRLFGKIQGYTLEQFEEVYIGGTHQWFGVYATLRGIEYNYFEDGCHKFWDHDNFLRNMYMINEYHGKILDSLEIVSAKSCCIRKIYTNVPDGQDYSDPRIVHFDVVAELQKFREEEKHKLYGVYGIDDDIFLNVKESELLLLTNYFCAVDISGIDSIEDQKRLYSLLVDYFAHDKRVCIKPHPSDLVDYKSTFPDACVLPRIFPVELFFTNMDCRDITAMSLTSSGSNMFLNRVEFEIPTDKGGYFLEKMYKYNSFKKIYNDLLQGYKLYISSPIFNIFKCMQMNAESYFDGLISFEDHMVILMDDKDEDISKFETKIKSHTILCLNYISDKLWDLMHDETIKFVVKKIRISSIDGSYERIENLYFIMNDDDLVENIRTYEYSKTLNYTKEVVTMECMDEQELEYNALKGILEATEKKLEKVLEENKMLRALLEESNLMPN